MRFAISYVWTVIEIDWKVDTAAGANDGYLKLWIDGTLKETLDNFDTDSVTVPSVRLGEEGLDANASATVYFVDYVSRRLTYIGTLASPYTTPQPPLPDGWTSHTYDCDDPAQPGSPHAVKSVDRPGSDSTAMEYDANGNMSCRVEVAGAVTTTWVYEYNAENRLAKIRLVSGTCATPGSDLQYWTFTYDGDGMRVKEDHFDGASSTITRYYMGGMYEVQGSTVMRC